MDALRRDPEAPRAPSSAAPGPSPIRQTGCRVGRLPTMAYVVAREGRRYEVRESSSTSRGPRARTLATFATFDDEVLARVHARAAVPVDESALLRSARKAGATVTVGQAGADHAARTLLAKLNAGGGPSSILAGSVGRRTRRRARDAACPHPLRPRRAQRWPGPARRWQIAAMRSAICCCSPIGCPCRPRG